jgi:glycosyltransferase involved in cell wall biosynthesis
LFVRAADAIIAVSQQTRRDLMARYGTPEAKIRVIYEGIDDRFAPIGPPALARIRQHYSPERPYLLMVGTLEPRKNHATAMRALARLKQAGHPHRLLISGGKGWLFEPVAALVDELGLTNDVTFAGRVPDADLPALYAGADGLLLPSLYEGFGFPVLEAMACGTPVVCADSSSLPEVAGDAALLVPAKDDEALAAAVERILTEPGLAEELRRRGAVQAARFRWETCAAETVALYGEVAGMSSER